ncbi:hypothetical protein WR25_14209 [Diploscapter pachys]|uniref:Uncharacterized protein n=1 Tax=Diploscapter pachys TaxID=2018661 RepID=A0A2A2LME7_9BILA|nr:hypothetical protein WR25_14209 [Diploscapter pachys]
MIKITEKHSDKTIDRLIAPEEASGELLKAMKQYAESYLGGQEVTDAVITMPAHFYTRQREATERAAQYAGFTNVQFLTEPAAAAIALAMKKQETDRTILIYDLGGGTFDVSIGRITNQELEILAIGGDTHLGGQDFDELIVKDFIAHFKGKHKISFPNDKIIRRRLRNQCREVKQNIMGIGSDLTIDMTFNVDGIEYSLEYKINRTKFNALCEPSFRCTMATIDNALCDAKLSQDQIDDILLVGGSTRIPRIRELIHEKFPRAKILQNVNPDEAIAIGAAIYAAQLEMNGPMMIKEERAKFNIAGALSTSSNVEPTKNKQTTSNPIGLENRVCIGIDLGTTFSCVAIVGPQNEPEPIPNNFGNRITPSIVAYDPKNPSVLIGEAAQNSLIMPTNMIYDAKRMIGRQFNDKSVQDDKKLWPFEVVEKEGKPHVKLTYNGNEGLISPEEISSSVLKEMKAIAEHYLSKSITGAVITVPAYFNHRQRAETMKAAELAGLKVLRLINEPTAAAIAYGQRDNLDGKTVLIYDLGGGTFDVSIVKGEAKSLQVISTAGHNHLGGQDFDQLIMKYVIEKYQEEKKKDFPTNKPKLMNRLRKACLEAKHMLSHREQPAQIHIENVTEDEDFNCELSRKKLNELIGPMLKGSLDIVDAALKHAKLSERNIDYVLLIGGSTRIPMVQELLAGKFGKPKLRYRINPDEAVALGASLLADDLEKYSNIEDNVKINQQV